MDEIDLTAAEDITLFTDEEQVEVQTVDRVFDQQSKLRGLDYQFTIFNDIQCYQQVKRKHGRKQKFRIDLSYLDPKPVLRFRLAEGWLFTTAILAVISFILIYIGWFKSAMSFQSDLLLIISIASITLTLMSLMIAILKTDNRMIFYSQFGRVPILEPLNKNPDKKSFTDFMQELSSHIISAQSKGRMDKTERLTRELKELRRLMNEEVITEQNYENAKKRIFSNKAFRN